MKRHLRFLFLAGVVGFSAGLSPAMAFFSSGSIENRSDVAVELRIEENENSVDFETLGRYSQYPLSPRAQGVTILRNLNEKNTQEPHLEVVVELPDGKKKVLTKYGESFRWK